MNVIKDNKRKKGVITTDDLDFLEWLNVQTSCGYLPPLPAITDFQEFIDKAVFWYEIRVLYKDGFLSENDVTKSMSFDAFYERLDDYERTFIDCEYRMGHLVDYWTLKIPIYDVQRDLKVSIYIDLFTGAVKKGDAGILSKLYSQEPREITITDIYNLLKDDSNYEIDSLKSVYVHHLLDLKLRRTIFEMIIVRLAESDRYNLTSAYTIAKMFAKDVETKYGIQFDIPKLLSKKRNSKPRVTDPIKRISFKKGIAKRVLNRELGI
ncbi:MAG: hypothetical protein HFG33_02975 [Bacilli bacterium]|nr:hypothetical protein [Bacilli bacterium]